MEPERTLTDPQRDEFEDMLRALTLERSLIKEAMGFALDNADAAGEVMLVCSIPYWISCVISCLILSNCNMIVPGWDLLRIALF